MIPPLSGLPGIRLHPWMLLILILGSASANGCAPTAVQPGASAGPAAVKMIVDSDGIFQLPLSDLRQAGLVSESDGEKNLSLSAGGRPVAFLLSGEGSDRSLRFCGQGLGSSAYDGRNVYWLTLANAQAAGPASHAIVAAPAAPPPGLDAVHVVSDTVHVEEQRVYQSQVDSGDDRWFWQPLLAPSEMRLTIATPFAAAGSGEIRLRVWGNSSAPANPDHHVLINLNGRSVAESAWDGLGAHVITGTVPSGVLHPGDNDVLVKVPGDTGARADSLLIDWAEISYPRELVLDGGALEFSGQARGFALRVPHEATVQSLLLWDITDPAQPVALTGYTIERDLLTFASDGALRRFLVALPAGLEHPKAVEPSTGPNLHDWSGGADMIIVTVPQFRQALEPLVAARRDAGMRVAVVDVSAVYDTFADGRAGPAAIRALVQTAMAHWTPPAPRFLLLAGDASYDPRDYLQGPEKDLVPTQLVNTAYTGWTASDVWYALPDESADSDQSALKPLLAVGRFPAQTPEEISTMVAKTLAYEREQAREPWARSALLLVDNDDPAFAVVAGRFADTIRAGYAPEIVALTGDGGEARLRLLQALEAGVGLVGYFGHGSMSRWAQEKILGIEDVPRLANRNQLPIVFTVTCLSGLFNHPTAVSLGEALLRAANGGAVAALVPSSAGGLPDQRFLAGALAESLAAAQSERRSEKPTLGEVIRAAEMKLPNGSSGPREMGLTFNLLGDPSLAIPR